MLVGLGRREGIDLDKLNVYTLVKKLMFPAVLRLQDRAQFHVQFPTRVLEIPGNSGTSIQEIMPYPVE